MPPGRQLIDRTGRTYGRLTVLSFAKWREYPDGRRSAYWLCRCACGVEKEVQGTNLGGSTVSCGCFHRDDLSARKKTHGGRARRGAPSRTYASWMAMKTRCYNPNKNGFHHWGGRGIEVCDRWLNSFENFLADMGERPEGRTLDRWPNVDGNYEPGNCRWATPAEQTANQRPKGSGGKASQASPDQ